VSVCVRGWVCDTVSYLNTFCPYTFDIFQQSQAMPLHVQGEGFVNGLILVITFCSVVSCYWLLSSSSLSSSRSDLFFIKDLV